MINYITRVLQPEIEKYLQAFPIVGITGPRQSGKSTMLKNLLAEKYTYVTFDDYRLISLLQEDPQKFIRIYNDRIIFDEVHKAPKLFDLLKIEVDIDRGRYGRFILTGSAQFSLMKGLTESLAGRIGLLSLLPFQYSEVPQNLRCAMQFKGGYPELVLREYKFDAEWYASYIETYLNRDLRSLSSIGDLGDFRKMIAILAARCAQIVNLSEIARDIGITVATAKRWISVLEASYIIFLLQPYYSNFGKRVIKSPKLYFCDTGLVAFLLGIETQKIYESGNMHGPLFENFIISEIKKKELHAGTKSDLYFFRTNYGLEVDLIIDRRTSIEWIEIKASETFKTDMVSAIETLKKTGEKGYLIYKGGNEKYLPDIKILNYDGYLLSGA